MIDWLRLEKIGTYLVKRYGKNWVNVLVNSNYLKCVSQNIRWDGISIIEITFRSDVTIIFTIYGYPIGGTEPVTIK